MIEIWQSITEFPGYEISNLGKVKSLPRIVTNGYKRGEKTLKIHNNKGYLFSTIYKNGKMYNKMIHRLIAKEFIPNPLNKPFVNHKDRNPLNNNIDNLEWSDNRENLSHGHLSRGKKTSQFTGVCWDRKNNKWMAYATINKKTKDLGRFFNEQDAADAYTTYLNNNNVTNKYKSTNDIFT